MLAPAASGAAHDEVPRIGFLGRLEPRSRIEEGFQQGLRELGYSEGKSIHIEWRNTLGFEDETPATGGGTGADGATSDRDRRHAGNPRRAGGDQDNPGRLRGGRRPHRDRPCGKSGSAGGQRCRCVSAFERPWRKAARSAPPARAPALDGWPTLSPWPTRLTRFKPSRCRLPLSPWASNWTPTMRGMPRKSSRRFVQSPGNRPTASLSGATASFEPKVPRSPRHPRGRGASSVSLARLP